MTEQPTIRRTARSRETSTAVAFTLVERKLIEYAAYVTEGHLCTVAAAHGLAPVSDAVQTYLRLQPWVLHRSEVERERSALARGKERQRLIAAAGRAFNAGELDRARKLIDDAEAVEPCRSVAGYRRKITAATMPALAAVAGV